MTETNEYGHVDEQGNVFLSTPEGPVKLGQYTVGDAKEALAFFAKRFDDLVAEIILTVSRLAEAKAPVESVNSLIERIGKAIESPNMLGDIPSLNVYKDELSKLVEDQKKAIAERKAAAKVAALAKREELVAAAESLANSTSWKVTGEKFKEMLDEWKAVANVDRGKEQELWKRFSAARSVFDKARRNHFAALDATRSEATAAKKALIAKAAELADSTEWAATTTAFKKLMDEWKGLARAGKSEEEKLWKEFKSVQDKFFTNRNTVNEARDEEFGKNLTLKQELAAAAEALLPIIDLDAVKSSLREISEKWEKIGHVPRNDKEKIERRLKAVEDAVRRAQEEIWHRSKPEVIERANGFISSFEASVEKLEKAIADAKAAKKAADIKKLEAQLAQTQALLDAARSGASKLG